MCWCDIEKAQKVQKLYNSDGTVHENTNENIEVPEHVDNPLLNTDVVKRILGFRYKTKMDTILVYSNIECKTFCLIMQLKPLKD